MKNIFENSSSKPRNAWFWVPTLYFAEGLPAALITTVSVVMFSNLGIDPEKTLFWTGLYSLPFMLRVLWVPLLDRIGTARGWILALQILLGGIFTLCGAISAFSGDFFHGVNCCFFGAAVLSATHDAAADGFYIIALDVSDQAKFSGLRSAYYKAGTVCGQGLLTMGAGCLLKYLSPQITWGTIYASAGTVMFLLSFYHSFLLPRPSRKCAKTFAPAAAEKPQKNPLSQKIISFFAPYRDVIKADSFLDAMAFLLLFRLAESQLRLAIPFLLADRSKGGMALTVAQQGFLYGTVGALALIAGGILSGYAVARYGMKRYLWPMALAINVPDLVYVYLSFMRPTQFWIIGSCVFVEQLGYGFGFTMMTLCMVCLAREKTGNETTRFAIYSALSLLGVMLPGSVAGYILKLPLLLYPDLSDLTLYRIFFLWVILCTIPSFIVTARMAKTLCKGFPEPGSVQ